MKRIFDFMAALLGLIILFPLFLISAIAVKLGDGGPVFFGQWRTGLGGKPFRMWKFRSMRVQPDSLGPAITIGTDSRITAMGHFLRKTKLDELPQLWNVLLGEMSFVGPRPEVQRYTDKYSPVQKRVLQLLPGITDPASFAFYNEAEILGGVNDPEAYYLQTLMPEKIRINLEYAEKSGMVSDLVVIVLTVLRPLGIRINLFSMLRLTPPSH
ncbi:MAG: sugar transferase [Bdellovibrionales bacterium]|nr:sugar transferase [Bdellovibrionales bacterium]